jgi:8-oxo-dGTP pyrophosphatase MutT (NUDIX family)
MKNNNLLRWVTICNAYEKKDFIPLIVDNELLGAISKNRLNLFENEKDVFIFEKGILTLKPQTFEDRTFEIEKVMKKWFQQGIVKHWKDEPYRVSTEFNSEPKFLIERAAASLLGIQKYGVHLNGFVRDKNNEIKMWIGRRSATSGLFPNKLDQLVAGGLGASFTPLEVLIKECGEEANIPKTLAQQAKSVGMITYCMTSENGNLSRDALFIYDLELPFDFIPENTDGETQSFYLWNLNKIIQLIENTEEFKTNCNLVVIDFLIRHGFVTPENTPNYLSLIQGLHGSFRFN